ncbi:trigger factor [Tuwongella immobilis]|uniref:Trigger factor n=1 Tax=Tuwongella immobilis TaxID=692036 RepID=A0A6C2YQ68_9BACT|nr:trigger factor [Tuwongella immobilis]VIP03263.1 trigger factor : Trigger factor OS=Singulisphaera acidiphila (strain ATCC BAA-1392 / DSM 18658 / VKM B-2454 / MOB10) GN=tig PE=3 SV=1: Trigger_N: Trigger_C [Tuwongella immobilis]VTS03877.1 trigger factor : Trigger factor OS=Singulisphaera acidiphila (strain ATCC BAA-1392 / DSM 18658 / VKM B-2454 / MOB10) GN=tig PE=3 SV=1: Trigger_N: Trigger_C [Tuwongella immobilis]
MSSENELTPNSPETSTPEPTNPETAVVTAEEPAKLSQQVEINDAGPCRKHIKVTVDRKDIDKLLNEKFTELVRSETSQVRGFRPGKAPRKMIEKRFAREVNDQVKTEVLMASLEQLASDSQISPLAPPDINPAKIEIPAEGPLVYEFNVEVRPEFDLPDYKGLKLKKPVKQFTDADIEKEKRTLLEPAAQLVPKEGENVAVETGDVVEADGTIKFGDRVLNELTGVRFRIEKKLALNDGVADDFDTAMGGAKVGDSRPVKIKLSESVADESLRGQEVDATFTVKEIKVLRMPELNDELLAAMGVNNEAQLNEMLQLSLERRLEYTQRQSARSQVLQILGESTTWDLPQDLLRRQARKTMSRRIMEMKNAGMSDAEIIGRQRLLEQDVLRSTALALKEHFVLQKIAELEKLEVEESDIDTEIEQIAYRSNESARKVRARLEKEDMIETLAMELLERKALDLILSSAEYTEVPLEAEQKDAEVATASAQAVPGEMTDPTAEPAAPESTGDSSSAPTA